MSFSYLSLRLCPFDINDEFELFMDSCNVICVVRQEAMLRFATPAESTVHCVDRTAVLAFLLRG